MYRTLIHLEDAFKAIKELQDKISLLDVQVSRVSVSRPVIPGFDATELEIQLKFLQAQINDILIQLDNQLPQELFADCTSNLTVPFGSFGDVPGCTLTLNKQGLYVVTAFVYGAVNVAAGELRVYLDVDGSRATPKLIILPGTSTGTDAITASFSQMWPVVHSGANSTAKLTADKGINGGGATVGATHTRLHARFVGTRYSVV